MFSIDLEISLVWNSRPAFAGFAVLYEAEPLFWQHNGEIYFLFKISLKTQPNFIKPIIHTIYQMCRFSKVAKFNPMRQILRYFAENQL